MNQFSIIVALIFSVIIAIFALANSQTVLINYLFGKAEVSAVIVILCSAVSGAFVIFLFNLVRQIKTSLRLRGLRNEIKLLEEKVKELEKERDYFQVQAEQFQQLYADVDDSGDLQEKASFNNKDRAEENEIREWKDKS